MLETSGVLVPREIIRVEPKGLVCRPTLFESDSKLWVPSSTRRVLKRFLAKQCPSELLSIQPFDITSDTDYPHKNSSRHIFTDAWALVFLFLQQKNGEKGALLTNGYANLFPFPNLLITATWDSDDKAWEIYESYQRRNVRDGDRSFVPHTANAA